VAPLWLKYPESAGKGFIILLHVPLLLFIAIFFLSFFPFFFKGYIEVCFCRRNLYGFFRFLIYPLNLVVFVRVRVFFFSFLSNRQTESTTVKLSGSQDQ